MSTKRYPVHAVVKNEDDGTVQNYTFHVSDSHPSDKRILQDLPAGRYSVKYFSEELSPDSPKTSHFIFNGDKTTLQLGVELKKGSSSGETNSFQADSSLESSSSKGSYGLLLGLSVVSLMALGNLKVPVDFSSILYPSKTLQPQQVRLSTQSSRTNTGGQPETTLEFTATSVGGQSEAASLSALGNKLRACLTTNIRDVWDVPTLADLAKKTTLVTVTDEQVRREVNQLYDKVDRLRQILQGCDPNLARYLIEARSRRANLAQPHSTFRASRNFAQPLDSITISTCDGRPGSAYYRSNPTRAEWAILGVVEQGEQVYLTNDTYEADGIVWYEAIAPSVVPDPDKQIMPNQIGWIAGCFVQ